MTYVTAIFQPILYSLVRMFYVRHFDTCTQFEVCSQIHSRDILRVPKCEKYFTRPRPRSCMTRIANFCYVCLMLNQRVKFEVCCFSVSRNIMRVPKFKSTSRACDLIFALAPLGLRFSFKFSLDSRPINTLGDIVVVRLGILARKCLSCQFQVFKSILTPRDCDIIVLSIYLTPKGMQLIQRHAF